MKNVIVLVFLNSLLLMNKYGWTKQMESDSEYENNIDCEMLLTRKYTIF